MKLTTPDWATDAPSLAHLAIKIHAFDDVTHGYAARAADKNTGEPEHLYVLLPDLEGYNNSQWIKVTADGASYFTPDGDVYNLTHAALFAFMKALPKPLHCYATCTP
jgi:hypothetical protein